MTLLFRVLAIVGLLTCLGAAGVTIHIVTHWYFWSGQ